MNHIFIIIDCAHWFNAVHVIMNLDSFWHDFIDKSSWIDKIYIRTCLFALITNPKRILYDKQSLMITYESYFYKFMFLWKSTKNHKKWKIYKNRFWNHLLMFLLHSFIVLSPQHHIRMCGNNFSTFNFLRFHHTRP